MTSWYSIWIGWTVMIGRWMYYVSLRIFHSFGQFSILGIGMRLGVDLKYQRAWRFRDSLYLGLGAIWKSFIRGGSEWKDGENCRLLSALLDTS